MKKIYEEPVMTATVLSVPNVLGISGEDDWSGDWEEEP